MMKRLARLVSDEKGATLVEYGLILGLIVTAMMVALTQFADATMALWYYVSDTVVNA